MGILFRALYLVIMIFPLFIAAQNQESILKSLRKSNLTSYKGLSRVLFLTTYTIEDLQTVFPGTDKTCEYILRYYFYTEIHLNKKSNVLFAMDGTKFQLAVWTEIAKIKLGTTKTYSEIANLLGKPKSARAVANACGKNLYAPTIPCHRVVRSDGKLGGYSGKGGIKTKKKLLEQEQR